MNSDLYEIGFVILVLVISTGIFIFKDLRKKSRDV